MMENKKKLNTLDKILLLVGVTTLLFVITMIVVFCFKDSVPDTLIVAWFGATFGEAGCCTFIWKSKLKNKFDK